MDANGDCYDGVGTAAKRAASAADKMSTSLTPLASASSTAIDEEAGGGLEGLRWDFDVGDSPGTPSGRGALDWGLEAAVAEEVDGQLFLEDSAKLGADAGEALGELAFRRKGLVVSLVIIVLVLIGLGLKIRQISSD